MDILTPDSAFSLIACDWRVQLDPACPYVTDTTTASASVLWFCLATAAFQWGVIARRVFFQKRHLLARSQSWFLPFNPHELTFWGAALYNTLRVLQLVILVYFNEEAPLFLKGFLFGFAPVIGTWSMIYYWISLVAALPVDHLADHKHTISQLMALNTVFGLVSFPLLFLMPFVEGVSAQFVNTNEPLSRMLLTLSYSLWAVVLAVLMVGVAWFGSKIVRFLEPQVRNGTRNLKKSLKLIKPSVLLIPVLAGATVGILLVLIIARYYVWAHREASLAICVIFNFTPPLFTLIFTGTIVCNELPSSFYGEVASSTGVSQGSKPEDLQLEPSSSQ